MQEGAPCPGKATPKRRRTMLAVVAPALLAAMLLTQCTTEDQGTPTGGLPTVASEPRGPAEKGSIPAIVEAIKPSVVAIFTQGLARDFFFQIVPTQGAGTGLVATSDGHILTNAHVVSDSRSIEVLLSDGKRLPAEIVGQDVATDLAVLKVKAQELKPAPFGDSGQLRVGDTVIAVGHALALPGGPTVTEGIVSALDRSIREETGAVLENLIQTDAAINPGNSGGALLDSAGNVVGINTAIAGQAQNIGFAIAISPARAVVDELMRSGKVVRPFLGIQMVTLSPAIASQQRVTVEEGALVTGVVDGSPAALSGLQPEDVIVEVEGKKVTDTDGVTSAINSKKPGDSLDLVVVRGRDRVKLSPTLAERE